MAREPRPRSYVITWVALVALTALTFAAANVDLGSLNTPVAYAIAVGKASLIALVFMHLMAEDFTMRFVLVGAALVMLLLVAVVTLEAHTRIPLTAPPGSATFGSGDLDRIQ